jgi:hypothetical protein
MFDSFAMMRAGLRRHATEPIHRAHHRSQKTADRAAANFGIFSRPRNPLKRQASPIVEPRQRIKCASRFDIFSTSSSHRQRRQTMVITSAHIQPIVALIAGVVILIMPRFLNLVVAIYLIFIGLAGLGLFRMFHI